MSTIFKIYVSELLSLLRLASVWSELQFGLGIDTGSNITLKDNAPMKLPIGTAKSSLTINNSKQMLKVKINIGSACNQESRLMQICKKTIKFIFAIAILAFTSSALAIEYSNLEVNSFFTQGFFLTDHNRVNGESDDKHGSWDFREIGINASYRLNNNLNLAGQIMSRKAGKVNDGSLDIDYLLADYRISESQTYSYGVKFGRMKNPYGLYNDTRDVAFTRPSIILPQSIYLDRARNFFLSIDGAMLYASHLSDKATLSSHLLIGYPRKGNDVETGILSHDWPGDIDGGKGAMLHTEYRLNDYSFITALTLGAIKLEFDAPDAFINPINPRDGDIKIKIAVLSLQYNFDKWSFTTEYTRRHIDWESLGGIYAFDPNFTSEAFYAQAEYRISPKWDLFIRRDITYVDISDRNGRKIIRRPAHTQYAYDWTIGAGYKPSPSWLLRAEWHHVKGTGYLAVEDNPIDLAHRKYWDMFALQLTYRF